VAAAAVPTPALAPAAEPVAAVAPWPLVLGGAWVVGGVAWLGLALVRVWGFHRLLRYARPATPALQAQADDLARQLGLSRGPKVWLLPGAVAPMLWGLTGRARLLLPADLLGRLDAAQRAALLAHELAHYRRGDHWVRFLELAVTAAYWWHPVVWWARGELHEAEEQCCDAWVVWALPGAARSYALAVVETVDFLAGVRAALPVGASGLGRVRHLKRRVTMILTERVPRALPRAGGLAFASLALVLLPLRAGWAQQPAPRDDRREERRSEDRREERRDERRTEERRPGGDLPPERREAIERTARELHDLHEKMRELAEHIRRTEQRLAELEGRRPDAGRTQGRDGDRRPEDRRADERRTEERRATEPRQGDGGDRRGPPPGMPGGAGGPGAPAFPPGGPNFQPPGGGFPGGAQRSGGGGRRLLSGHAGRAPGHAAAERHGTPPGGTRAQARPPDANDGGAGPQ
jgi:beta-lactamase regulating signal transducer with metallopeptidase domain